MRYCTRCQRIEEKEIERCSICHKQLKRNIEENDPVFLLETSILESERIEAALEDEGSLMPAVLPKKNLPLRLLQAIKMPAFTYMSLFRFGRRRKIL